MNDLLNENNGKDHNKLTAKEQAARAKANKEMSNYMKEVCFYSISYLI